MDVALPASTAGLPSRPLHRTRLAGGAGAIVVLTSLSGALGLAGDAGNPSLAGAARALITGVPMAVGLYAWHRQLHPRFGLLLFASGVLWCLTTLAESSDPDAYTLGRLAGWLSVVLFVTLILAFPSGRLATRTDRRLAGAMLVVVLVLYVPRLLLAESFEVPSPYTSCTEDCPPNALFALASEPGFVQDAMRPLGTLAAVAVTVATVVRLGQRHARASPVSRAILAPVVLVSAAFAVLLAASLAARQSDFPLGTTSALAWAIAFSMPAVSGAFLLGLLRGRLFAGRTLTRIAACLDTAPDARALQRAFAEALHDPSLRLLFPARDGTAWRDVEGHPASVDDGDPRSVTTEIPRDGRVVAAVRHDRALLGERELLAACATLAGVALDNQRLIAESDAALRELERSRARIAATAEQERQRIERDLHDGAQQRLVALRIELGLTEELVRTDPAEAAVRLHAIEDGVDEALEDLRALAHGVYPPLLADRGLVEALQAVGTRSTTRVTLTAHGVGRYSAQIESAVYFCVLEALQNVLKHAVGATRADVELDVAAQQLRVVVRDNGAGAHDGRLEPGAGVTNMRDRLAAVGGTLEIESTPHVGTVVRGRVPLPAVTRR